jgi:hypothetical protein
MKKSSGLVFINTSLQKQFPNGPKVSAEFQIIVAKNKDDDWFIDSVEPMDIDEIEMMGKKITDYEGKRKIITHFQSIGINLWDESEKDINEFIAMSGDVVTFVKEQTGIILPTNKQLKVVEPKAIESEHQETGYVNIMKNLKQQFGNIGYYNDKRKDSRRIKIISSQNKDIQKYMKRKYPHIETYYNNGDTWSIGLCFVLPL